MNDIIQVLEPDAIVAAFDVDVAAIEVAKAKYRGLDAAIPDQYKLAIEGRRLFRDTRLGIEECRKKLKADSLEYGRRVDAVAKEKTALVQPMEDELDAQIKAVDKAKADAKRAEIEAERQRKEAEARAKAEAEAAAERERIAAEEARLAAERAAFEAEQKRLAEIRAAEEAELARQRAEIEAERKRVAAEQRAREEAEAKAREEREAIEQAEQRRLAGLRVAEEKRLADERSALLRERQRLEQEEAERQARIAEAERQAALAARLEALKPDMVKIREFAAAILAVRPPPCTHPDGQAVVLEAMSELRAVASKLRWFTDPEEKDGFELEDVAQ